MAAACSTSIHKRNEEPIGELHHAPKLSVRGPPTGHGDTQLLAKELAKPAVDLEGWHLEVLVKKLQYTSFEDQRLIITKDVLALGPPGGEFDEIIPFHEIDCFQDLSAPAKRGLAPPGVDTASWRGHHSLCSIATVPEGFNTGRVYIIAAEFPFAIAGQYQDQAPARSRPVPEAQGKAEFQTQTAFLACLRVLASEAKVRQQPKVCHTPEQLTLTTEP